MLASLTSTGLQDMIDLSNDYIKNHSLRFNPSKTECVIFGQCNLNPHPNWSLNDTVLHESSKVKYLGVTLSSTNTNEHVRNRIESCRKAFYALQGVGHGLNGKTNPEVLSYVWNSAIRPILTYGISCVKISKSSMNDMEKLQSRLLKSGFNLHKCCKSSPLLNALNVKKVENTMEIGSLDLVKSIFNNTSRARSFYTYLLNSLVCDRLNDGSDLVSRSYRICQKHNVSLIRYIFNDEYSSKVRNDFKKYRVSDGLTDSVRQLLLCNNPFNRHILNLLLKSF